MYMRGLNHSTKQSFLGYTLLISMSDTSPLKFNCGSASKNNVQGELCCKPWDMSSCKCQVIYIIDMKAFMIFKSIQLVCPAQPAPTNSGAKMFRVEMLHLKSYFKSVVHFLSDPFGTSAPKALTIDQISHRFTILLASSTATLRLTPKHMQLIDIEMAKDTESIYIIMCICIHVSLNINEQWVYVPVPGRLTPLVPTGTIQDVWELGRIVASMHA